MTQQLTNESLYKDKFNKLKSKTDNCYSPYSNIKIVSLINDEKNNDFFGVNVENSSYSLTVCSERSCIVSAISQGVNVNLIREMLIYTNSFDEIIPCGACLQFISEFTNDKFKIITLGNNNKIMIYKIKDLFPKCFECSKN